MIDQVLKFTCDVCGATIEQELHDIDSSGDNVIEMPDGWHCYRGKDLCAACLPAETIAAGQKWVSNWRQNYSANRMIDGNDRNDHALMASWVNNLRAKGGDFQGIKARAFWSENDRCGFVDSGRFVPPGFDQWIRNCGDALERSVSLGFDVPDEVAGAVCHMKGYRLWLAYVAVRRCGETQDAVQGTIEDLNEMLEWLANAAAS